MSETMKTIQCPYIRPDDRSWDQVTPEPLVDVVTGERVEEPTDVRTSWDDDALYIRFDCQDDYAVADYTRRDDPLYDQDVVEVFIDEEGLGRRYIELELSPRNVVFDAIIENVNGKITVDTDWDAEDMTTHVWEEGGRRVYELRLPFAHFAKKPEAGTEWRINFYRIDEDRNRKRHFQAWSPTGAVDYHIASRFGTIRFVK
ncbi:carbohydrate-binding family 9-like protein [Paenibacillus sp. HJGM_3]|uniref:carbohydrate-binding family 9-like protein n=1 Tax=Paenibacillus sp. HJGM_3 TaxID=3379816 RepID=UPI003859B9B5